MLTIKLQTPALLGLIRSAWEVDNQESIGILFGYVSRGNDTTYVVESIHPHQKVRWRKPTSVTLSKKRNWRGSWTVPSVEDEIGEYHSHHGYWNGDGLQKVVPHFSGTDEECFRENSADLVSIVLAMNRIKRYVAPSIGDKKISGTVLFEDHERKRGVEVVTRKRYHIAIAGYYWEKNTGNRGGRPRRAYIDVDEEHVKEIFSKDI